MPKPIIVLEATQVEPIFNRPIPETFDTVPADPDYYVVTMIAGPTVGRVSERDIPTLGEAWAAKCRLDAKYGAFGRRSTINAVKGIRTYSVRT